MLRFIVFSPKSFALPNQYKLMISITLFNDDMAIG